MSRGASQHLRQIHHQQQNETQKQKQQQGWAQPHAWHVRGQQPKISMRAPDPTYRPSGPFLPFWPRESTPDPRNRILDSTPVGRKVQHAESTVPVHPQPRPFTPQLFLDFRAIFFPAWPIIFLIITKNQVIWPSPGTLVVSVNSLKFQFQFFTLNLKNSDKTKMSGRQWQGKPRLN